MKTLTNTSIFPGDRIPTLRECDDLMARYGMRPNIAAHSRQVMRVALAIADNLDNGAAVDRDLVMAAALLHDITKTRALETKESHDRTGGKLLRELGFPRVGEIVEQHVILADFDPESKLSEREIVNYADKRVMHDTVVSLDERVEDLVLRYGVTEAAVASIRRNHRTAGALERKIRAALAVDLEDAIGDAAHA